jgi:hypothetical protein
MPVDKWLILALIMIFSSIIFCAVIPIIIRLSTARRRYRRYRLELQDIVCSSPDVFFNLHSIYQNMQIANNEDDFDEHSIMYSEIPFIDDLNKEDDTFV